MNTLRLFSLPLPLPLPFAVFLIGLFFASISFAASIDDLTFGQINNGSEYAVTDCDTAATGSLIIPATYMGKPVTRIGDYAFSDCILTSVTVPVGVTSIGEEAFAYCYDLETITLPEGLLSIGDYAFFESGLVSLDMPNSLTVLGDGAFSDCYSLSSVTISNSLTQIPLEIFYNCESLESVTIPNGVTSIQRDAFYSCESLESVTIPNTVTLIGDGAFLLCAALTEITIPSSVNSIGTDAFEYCASLTSVYFEGSPPSFGTDVFLNTPEELTLYVQAGYLADYQALALGESLATYGSQASGIYYTISSSFDIQNNRFSIVSEDEDSSLNTQVQYSEDLAGGTGIWTTLSNLAYIEATNTADNTITRTITNVDPSVNAQRFYRLYSQP